jgi:uncharacterized membrane protein YidH (DUF202 family)
MRDLEFIYGVLFAMGAFLYYKFYRWWLRGREKNDAFYKPNTKIYIFKNVFVIVVLIIMSLIYFIRTIKNMNL